MAQKVLVNGTAYDLKPSPVLIDGTKSQIGGGRTLVNGTGYDIKLKSEETWLLNTNPKWEGIKKYDINFISNGEAFIGIAMDFVLRYTQPNGNNIFIYAENGGWGNTTYRTITFDEEPTGDLLTWLEANGTRV